MGGGSWFQKLFGFREGAYDETQKKLQLNEDRTALRGPNGIDYQIGRFRTPSLAELEALLEEQGGMGALPGRLVVKNIVGEISAVIGDAANGKSTIQVASQFNCLEFPSPSALPEDGVTGYVGDRTQGPACSIACGPATVYRNYFAEVGGEIGQRSHRQINNLADICALLDNGDRPPGRYFDVENGYTMSDDARLGALNARLPEEDLEALKRALRVGVHDDVQVSSRNWGTEQLADQGRLVSQVNSTHSRTGNTNPNTAIPKNDGPELKMREISHPFFSSLSLPSSLPRLPPPFPPPRKPALRKNHHDPQFRFSGVQVLLSTPCSYFHVSSGRHSGPQRCLELAPRT